MSKTEQLLIKMEFDKIFKYLNERKDILSKEEILQEIGYLKIFVLDLMKEFN